MLKCIYPNSHTFRHSNDSVSNIKVSELIKVSAIVGAERTMERRVLFLYGRLNYLNRAVAYCRLHECYLQPRDIAEKNCNKKKCKYKINVEDWKER